MTSPELTIHAPLTLPCGATLANRLAKAAMTEGLADELSRATPALDALYGRWARGGAALLLTGNVQVDRRYMERPCNVAIDGPQSPEAMARLKSWAQAGTAAGNHLWVQLSHAGRQTPASLTPTPVGPSDKGLQVMGKAFGRPRALTGDEILDVIARFGHAAAVCREAGFTGVQLHGAHGYLLSAFLSPDVNTRTDEWGGSLANRARLLLETLRAVRRAVGDDFPVSVKLNSADFQKGGFTHAEAIQVAQWLEAEKLDLLEISGGTYEQPKMLLADRAQILEKSTEHLKASTIAREAYFLEYARDIRAATRLPLMVTGGFRSVAGMNAALKEGGIDMIGLGRPLCLDPHLPAKLLSGEVVAAPRWEAQLRLSNGWLLGPKSPIGIVRDMNALGPGLWFQYQVLRMGQGAEPDPNLSLFKGMTALQKHDAATAKALVRS